MDEPPRPTGRRGLLVLRCPAIPFFSFRGTQHVRTALGSGHWRRWSEGRAQTSFHEATFSCAVRRISSPRNTMSDRSENLTDGRVERQIVRISAPMSLGIFSVLAIGLADAYFLARAGDAALAAVGFVYPVIVAVTAFSVGLSAGANAALSQARGGERNAAAVSRLGLHATLLGLAAGLAIASVFWLAASPLFSALGAKGEVLDNILVYLPWWIASFPVLVVTMILNAAFRAAGDGVTAAAAMVVTAALNIGFTPVLIFGYGPLPAMGMEGAGLGTFLARAIALAGLGFLTLKRGMIAPGQQPFEGFAASAREIVGIALPAGLSRAINPAGLAVVTAAVATVGDVAVAGFGAASRIQAIALYRSSPWPRGSAPWWDKPGAQGTPPAPGRPCAAPLGSASPMAARSPSFSLCSRSPSPRS